MENMTRQELSNFIKTKEAELDELRTASANGEVVDFGKMSRIEVEIEDANNELEKMAELEGEYESGSNLAKAQQEYEDQEDDIEESQIQDIREIQIEEEQKQDKGEFTLTITDWQIKTGIEIIPDEYIKQRYDKYLTEEEFKDILANENVPKIIKEPGKAEVFLKTPEDWESVRTSMSSLEEAIRNNNFPIDVNDQSYILLQYDKDKIRDEHKDKDENGYAQIDDEDIHGISENDDARENVEEEQRLEEEANSQDETGTLWNKIKIGLKNGMKIVAAKEMLEAAKDIATIAGVVSPEVKVAAVALSVIEKGAEVGKQAFDKISNELNRDLNNPNPLEANEQEQDIEEEPLPGFDRKIY